MLTQAGLARALGISRLTYIAIENGDKKPTIDQIDIISSVFGMSTQELLFPNTQSDSPNSKNLSKYRQMCLACIKFGAKSDGKITKTKLAKLLYLVDFSWFADKGLPMSGLEYRALPRGPVADQFFQITDEMFESGQVEIDSKGAALLFSITEEPSLDGLSKDELNHIKKVAEKWRSADTQTIVEFTHNQTPWTSTLPGMKIAYSHVSKIPPEQLY